MRTLTSWTYTLLGATALLAAPAQAQGTFQTLDPFYQDESARRDFYGGIALSGEVGYRQGSLLQPASEVGSAAGTLALSAQLDYALLPQVDLSAIIDLSGGVGRGPVGLSWVILKPYWHNEGTDYAVRIAVDPASEGSLGFRQTDVAFLSTSALSPTLVSDFAVGLRRVSAGYDTNPLNVVEADPDGAFTAALIANTDRVRLIGKELHASWGYNAVFDPGGSRISVALLGEAGDYTLVSAHATADETGQETASEERVRSGIAWLRTGLEFSRPSYQLAPYISVPLVTWASVRGEPVRHGPRPDRARFGLRVTFR